MTAVYLTAPTQSRGAPASWCSGLVVLRPRGAPASWCSGSDPGLNAGSTPAQPPPARLASSGRAWYPPGIRTGRPELRGTGRPSWGVLIDGAASPGLILLGLILLGLILLGPILLGLILPGLVRRV